MLRPFTIQRLVACAVLLTAVPLQAAWVRLRADGLEVYTDAGGRSARQVWRRLETIRQVFPPSGASPRPLRVYVFGSRNEFTRYRLDEGISGFYQSGADYNAIVTHAGESIDRVMVHEFVHFLLHQGDARLPMWLEEGLAEFYSNAVVSGGRLRVGEPIRESLEVLKSRRLLPPEQLASANPEAMGPDGAGTVEREMFYAQSWALTHMLFLAPDYRGKMPLFLAALNNGEDHAQAFRQAFGKPLADAITEIPIYIRTMRSTTLDAPDIAAAADPAAEDLSKLDALLLRANLALETGRLDTARPLIDQAAREFPDEPGTVAALGSMAYAGGDRDTARELFERAARLNPGDGAAWFELALLAQGNAGSSASVPELLERAVSLNPNLGEAHLLLGVRYTDDGKLQQAVEHLRQASRILPRQSYVWHALAFALEKRGLVPEAADAAGRALRTATSPEQVRMAEALLASLRPR